MMLKHNVLPPLLTEVIVRLIVKDKSGNAADKRNCENDVKILMLSLSSILKYIEFQCLLTRAP